MDYGVLRSAVIPERSHIHLTAEQIIFWREPVFLHLHSCIGPVQPHPMVQANCRGGIISRRNILSSAKSKKIICFKEILMEKNQASQRIIMVVIVWVIDINLLAWLLRKVQHV